MTSKTCQASRANSRIGIHFLSNFWFERGWLINKLYSWTQLHVIISYNRLQHIMADSRLLTWTGPTLRPNGWADVGCHLREVEARIVHAGNAPSAWGWPRQRDAIHHPRPPRLLHHQQWPYQFLQLMSYWAGWFLWWGVADMGLGSTAKCHPPIIHTYSQGHIWGGGLRAHSGRFEVCSVTVSKDA